MSSVSSVRHVDSYKKQSHKLALYSCIQISSTPPADSFYALVPLPFGWILRDRSEVISINHLGVFLNFSSIFPAFTKLSRAILVDGISLKTIKILPSEFNQNSTYIHLFLEQQTV